MATRNEKKIKRMKLAEARKEFTRSRAERALRNGADPTESRFTNHANYHVRYKAWVAAGAVVPETKQAQTSLFEVLTKGCSLGYSETIKRRLGLLEENGEAKAA
jgi:hypothetical protein